MIVVGVIKKIRI